MKRISFALLVLALSAPAQAAATTQWDIPNLHHERVDYWVQRFSHGDKRKKIALFLERKPHYEKMISRKLRARGMPQDLIYLAMIESGFNTKADSKANAVGIWQLSKATARLYGLRVTKKRDDRLDPEKETDAALRFLGDLHHRFGSWYLAAAAYNGGQNRVGRIMRKAHGSERGTDRDYYKYWHRLPGETRDYVPAMVAAARIGKHPAKYGF
jgi:peptidoglycan lytic transglycosylase D